MYTIEKNLLLLLLFSCVCVGGGGEPVWFIRHGGKNEMFLIYCCFTSTEARWPVRDWDRVGRGRQSEGSTAETARKRPERPLTAAEQWKC